MNKSIEGLESGARNFISLYEEVKTYSESVPDIYVRILKFFKEDYEYIKEMME